MSLNFWINLSLALLVLASAITFVYQYKHGVIRRLRARNLRRNLVPKLQAISLMIPAEFASEQPDLYPIFRLRADIETLATRAHVLFDQERESLNGFLTLFSSVLVKVEGRAVDQKELDDLILIGQRTILELKEIGF